MRQSFKRTYRSELRATQAEATRQAVLAAAGRVVCAAMVTFTNRIQAARTPPQDSVVAQAGLHFLYSRIGGRVKAKSTTPLMYWMHDSMSRVTEPAKRSYRSDLRASQANATRKAVIDAAGRVCRAGGWPTATIASIAKEAGVSKETIYATFGNKVALIGETVKANVAEHMAPGQHYLDQKRPRAIAAESDPVRQIELWAGYLTDHLKRVAPLMSVVRTGAQTEPEMSKLYRTLHGGRHANFGIVAQSIVRHGQLRDGLTVEEVTDILWQAASPEMFSLLTEVSGYSNERFARWLADTLKTLLLP